jgi:hypothetical protein
MQVVRPPRRWAPLLAMADLEEKGRIEAFFYVVGAFATYLSVVALALAISFALHPPYSNDKGQLVNPGKEIYDRIYSWWVLGPGMALSFVTVLVFSLSRSPFMRRFHVWRFIRAMDRRNLTPVFMRAIAAGKASEERFFRVHNMRSWNREFIKQSILQEAARGAE